MGFALAPVAAIATPRLRSTAAIQDFDMGMMVVAGVGGRLMSVSARHK
jgi:hypothetical protein